MNIFQLCDTLLSEVDPIVMTEQKFCVRFFHMSHDLHNLTERLETQSVCCLFYCLFTFFCVLQTGSGDSGGLMGIERRAE
jgi:hypothetical protein